MKSISKKFEINISGSFGRGLFATELIRKDEQILEFTGPIITLEESWKKPREKSSCPLQIEPSEYIDLQEPGVLVNHSCTPNAGVRDDRYLVAIQDIQSGEEILYDYSTSMDEDGWTLACKCENQNCRIIVQDFKYLPPAAQKYYLELNIVQSFIRKKLLARVNSQVMSG